MQSSRSKDQSQNRLQTESGISNGASLLQSSRPRNGRALSAFLRRDFDESLDLIDASLGDKMLIEFPVFALNEDYMKALAITIQNKIDHIKNIIEEKQQSLIMPEPAQVEIARSETTEKASKSTFRPAGSNIASSRIQSRQGSQLRDHHV